MNNDEQVIQNLEKLRDPKYYLENFCKVKTKSAGLRPFILKEAQKDIYNTIRENSRIIILKARQIGFCQHPSTKVLTSNLEWVTLDDIKIGQTIIAVDENIIGGKGSARKIRNSVVEKKFNVYSEAIKLTMDDGSELIATPSHKFLFKDSHKCKMVWKRVDELKIGDETGIITKTWDKQSYEDGWFGGMIDGEGSLSKPNRTGVCLTISQVNGYIWNRLLSYVESNNINYRVEIDKRKSGDSSKLGCKEVNKVVISNMFDLLYILGKTSPSRFKDRSFWEGKRLGFTVRPRIMKIEKLKKQRMIDLQTSEKTYIANGFISHNSTAITGWIYHYVITHPGVTAALIGYNSSMTSELLDKVKTFISSTPSEVRPTLQYNSKYELSFPSIDSKILVLPSTENVGRGYTINLCLCTELAFWEKPEEKMAALENSVPIDGKIIIESTPNGQGNVYHRIWMTEDNGYEKKQYGWWWEYTKEQIEHIRKRMNNPRKFAQEYELEFLASGRSVFDQNVIKDHRKNILNVGDKTADGHIVYEEDGLRVYREPEPDKFYVCGVDVSEGVYGGDYSVATFYDRMTGEEVAMYRGFLAPDRLGDKLDKWGRKYNNTLMVVEINNHGLTTVTILKQHIYPSMYFRPAKFDVMGTPVSDKLGWQTNKRTKPILIDDFAQAMREDELIIHSKETLDEMSVFIYDDNNNMTSQEGFHDDAIIASAIAYQGFKILYDGPLTQIDQSKHLPVTFTY